MKQKPVLYLAGDSTAQSYDCGDRPQAGWGELLLSSLRSGNSGLERASGRTVPWTGGAV